MASPGDYGIYTPTTWIFDVASIQQIDVNSPEFKELLIRLYQNLNRMALALNIKDSAYYNTQEFVNSQLYFPNPANNSTTLTAPAFRNVFRTVVNFGALPSNGTPISVAHNIKVNGSYTFTRIYAAASDTTNLKYLPIPYSSAVDVAHNISLDVTATNVIITSGGHDYSSYTVCYVVLEYLKN